MSVTISFIENIINEDAGTEHEKFLMTVSSDVYPTYAHGDRLFLQITNREDESKAMKLTEFWIKNVAHAVHEKVTKTFGSMCHMGIEVYVARVD